MTEPDEPDTTPGRFRSKFWDDLAEGMKNPEFRRAFEESQAELAALQRDAGAVVTDLPFVREVLALFARADCHSELYWHVDGDEIKLFALVNDVFAWGCADAEAITPERLPVLEQAFDDLLTVHGTEHLAALYGARIRKTRPQGAAFPKETAIAELFSACGPARSVGLGNPKPQPEEKP